MLPDKMAISYSNHLFISLTFVFCLLSSLVYASDSYDYTDSRLLGKKLAVSKHRNNTQRLPNYNWKPPDKYDGSRKESTEKKAGMEFTKPEDPEQRMADPRIKKMQEIRRQEREKWAGHKRNENGELALDNVEETTKASELTSDESITTSMLLESKESNGNKKRESGASKKIFGRSEKSQKITAEEINSSTPKKSAQHPPVRQSNGSKKPSQNLTKLNSKHSTSVNGSSKEKFSSHRWGISVKKPPLEFLRDVNTAHKSSKNKLLETTTESKKQNTVKNHEKHETDSDRPLNSTHSVKSTSHRSQSRTTPKRSRSSFRNVEQIPKANGNSKHGNHPREEHKKRRHPKEYPSKEDPAQKHPAKGHSTKNSTKKHSVKEYPTKNHRAKEHPANESPPEEGSIKEYSTKDNTSKEQAAKKHSTKKHPIKEYPAKDHPVKEHSTKERLSKEHPAREDTAKQHFAKKHPMDEYPAKDRPLKESPTSEHFTKEYSAKKHPRHSSLSRDDSEGSNEDCDKEEEEDEEEADEEEDKEKVDDVEKGDNGKIATAGSLTRKSVEETDDTGVKDAIERPVNHERSFQLGRWDMRVSSPLAESVKDAPLRAVHRKNKERTGNEKEDERVRRPDRWDVSGSFSPDKEFLDVTPKRPLRGQEGIGHAAVKIGSRPDEVKGSSDDRSVASQKRPGSQTSLTLRPVTDERTNEKFTMNALGKALSSLNIIANRLESDIRGNYEGNVDLNNNPFPPKSTILIREIMAMWSNIDSRAGSRETILE